MGTHTFGTTNAWKPRNVLLGCCGSSAADKVPQLVHDLKAAGFNVKLLPTGPAWNFIKDIADADTNEGPNCLPLITNASLEKAFVPEQVQDVVKGQQKTAYKKTLERGQTVDLFQVVSEKKGYESELISSKKWEDSVNSNNGGSGSPGTSPSDGRNKPRVSVSKPKYLQDHKQVLKCPLDADDIYRDEDEWSFVYSEFGMPVRACHL